MKRKLKGKIAILMLFTLVIGMIKDIPVSAAQESGTEITATITVASNISKQDMQTYLDGFRKKYPGIQVEYQSHSDYENEVGQQIADNDYPDVLFVPGSIGADQYDQYFEPLGSKEELDKKYNYLESGKMNGDTVYGIPSSAYVNGILYNKEVFDKAGISETPKTIDDFLDDLRMIRQRTDAIPFYTNYAADWTLKVWEEYPFIEMTGDPDYRENGFVNELDPFLEGTTHYQVYGLLYDIVKDGLCEDNPEESNWDDSKVMLNEGKIGCMAIGSWALKQVKDSGNNGDAVAYMPFPNEIDGKQYMTISTDYCYAINKNSQQKEAARCYIDYMLDESGYALDHQVLSLVKTDPSPAAYGNMDNVVCLANNEASSENYRKKQILSTNLDLTNSTDEIKRVIEAAEGKQDETFDDIAKDWNERWESSRTEDMLEDSGTKVSVLGSVLSENYEVEFSETEQEYLDSLKKIRVGYLNDMPPYQYQTEDGFGGVSKELVDILKTEFGVSIEEVGYDSTQQIVDALKNGEIDMAAGIQKASEYAQDLKFSTDCIEYMEVMVKSDAQDTDKALTGTMAQTKGEYYSDFRTEASKTLDTDSLLDSLYAIENLKADFTVANYYSVYYYMQQNGLDHLSLIPVSQNGKLYFAYAKDVDTRLISVCNKVLYSIPEENKQIMLNNSLKSDQQKITMKRFIEANTIPCLLTITIIFIIIVLGVIFIMRDRDKIAKTDALTGMNNRYGIRDDIHRVYEKKLFPLAFAILDIDNFKKINDTLGHAGGDEALKLLASELRKLFPGDSLEGRYGGDEFVFCVWGKEPDVVEQGLQTLVQSMNRDLSYGDATAHISISLGAVLVRKADTYEEIFKAADRVLYEVKKNGKNGYQLKEFQKDEEGVLG